MSPEKTTELINIYPELFSDLDHRNCFRLFSFECDNGWFDLLKDLITEIKSIIQKDGISPCIGLDDKPIPLKINQVKEKYGGLRFYTNWITETIEKAVERAEARSLKTCELCGEPGLVKAVRPYWYKCVCEKCFSLK